MAPHYSNSKRYLALLLITFISSFTLFSQSVVTFSNSGTNQTWTVPCGITSITVHVYGGGGGGGGSATTAAAGGGGGGGGYASATFAVNPNDVITFDIGAGGAGGVNNANGSIGGQSVVYLGANLIATGGTGGIAAPTGLGGTGGTGSFWATNISGNSGNPGGAIIGGHGGSANGPFGGSGGLGGPSGIDGSNGALYGGGGGGGGKKSGSSSPDGGAGANGGVIFEYTPTITEPNAGADWNLCGVNSLFGNTPDAGWTGTWSIVSGSATISNPNNPTSNISGIAAGSCVTFRWTFTSPGCQPLFDDVTICRPVICNDDPCGAMPIAVSTTGCAYTQYSNVGATASTGMAEPGCGSYIDNDVWFSLTVPANGTVTLQAIDNGAPGTVVPSIAVYEGDCFNLQHAGCDQPPSTSAPAEITYNGTPGSTLYIRVWDYFDSENGFGLCAYTHTNAFGDILSGENSITCGGVAQFTDPGGTGNYSVNSSAQYIICPDTPGQFVSIQFGQFALENGYDKLTILDGGGTGAPIIGQWTGTNNPGTITSSAPDGCLTVMFQSDNIITNTGWVALVTCSSTPGTNTYVCSPTNCSGECGQWICQDGIYPTTNDGNGIEDLAIGTSGCFGAAGEVASKWFYFTILNDGTIEFTFDGPNGQDYDFAVWGPSTDGNPPCPFNTGEGPIRCSYADVSNTANPVGLNQALGGGEQYEGAEGDGWVDALYTQAGETYAMILNIYMNGNPQPEIDLTIGGTGTIDCTPVFQPIELYSIDAINQGDKNYISWITASELNNDYFTLEKSIDGMNWEYAGTVDGAGTTQQSSYYALYDPRPHLPVTYYRVRQTDFDGEFSYSNVVFVNVDRMEGTSLISEVFPNPASAYVTFVHFGSPVSKESPLNIKIVDENGAIVQQNNYVELVSGFKTLCDVSRLANGSYQFIASQGTETSIQNLVILH